MIVRPVHLMHVLLTLPCTHLLCCMFYCKLISMPRKFETTCTGCFNFYISCFFSLVGSTDPCLTAGCKHDCVVNSDRTARCMCPKGYIISSDGKTCTDHDECSTNNGGCEAICTNSEGSFECSCHRGYTLSANLLFCEGM